MDPLQTTPFGDLSGDTLTAIRNQVVGAHTSNTVTRDITTALGLRSYDLQAPAKSIVPFLFTLSQRTPRVPGKGDIATRWKVITGINTTGLEGGTPEGQRQFRQTTTEADKLASYATIGLEDSITFEANLAATAFEDLRARGAMNLLYSAKLDEEFTEVGGNQSTALGHVGAITTGTATTGGTIADGTTVHVRVVPLTLAGLRNATVAGGIPLQITGTGPDGQTITYGGGSGSISTDVNQVAASSANTNVVTATWPALTGAVAYAVFWGATAAGATLGAIVTINSARLTVAVGTGSQLASAVVADNSINAYVFDGMIPLAFANGTVTTMATGTAGTGTGLTASGAGTITEIDSLNRAIWDAYRTSPDYYLLNAQEMQNIYAKILANGGSPLIRFNLDASNTQGGVMAGSIVGSYLNQFTPDGGKVVKLILHPYMPKGTILAITERIPGMLFPGSNMGQLFELHIQQDWYQIDWPLRTRAYEFGVYVREVLAHYFPATLGLITNIGNA